MADYDADIERPQLPDGTEGSRAWFVAQLRNSDVMSKGFDPEHDLCHEMTKAGLPDGSIQFWRNGVASLSYRSVHRTGAFRIAGTAFLLKSTDGFPYEVVKRRTRADIVGTTLPVAIYAPSSVSEHSDAPGTESGCTGEAHRDVCEGVGAT